MFLFIGLMIAAILLALVMRAVYALLSGLAFMHAIGIIHHEWLPQLPTLGYWWAVVIAFLIGAAIVPPTTANSSKD